MATLDLPLQAALTELAKDSNGTIRFTTRLAGDIGRELGVTLRRSPNPIYEIQEGEAGKGPRFVAYTLALNASGRIATRVEALGRAVADSDGKLFTANPFLFVYDYHGQRVMAVSAAVLFETFVREIKEKPIRGSESAYFSFTPNFEKKTMYLYGKVPSESIWSATVGKDFNLASLRIFLERVRRETEERASEIPEFARAVKARIDGGSTVGQTADVATIPTTEITENVRIPDRIWNMVIRSVRSSPAVILVGPPGTGKTALLRKAIATFAADAAFSRDGQPMAAPCWATPEESWTARELIGGETVRGGEIQFQSGWVLKAIEQNRWLILDEANRADMDRIFGGLLTWLSGGKVTVGRSSSAADAAIIELAWASDKKDSGKFEIPGDGDRPAVIRFTAGTSWRLLGTYNAVDAQRVFRFGAALGRRFARVPIPAADPHLFAQILAEKFPNAPSSVREQLKAIYGAHYAVALTQLGPAVFLAMLRYFEAAAAEAGLGNVATAEAAPNLSPATQEPARAAAVEPNFNEIVAEAYVVNVGSWLAHLDPRDLDELRSRVLAAGALTESDWQWISTMVKALA